MTPLSCGLIHYILDWEVRGLHPAIAKIMFWNLSYHPWVITVKSGEVSNINYNCYKKGKKKDDTIKLRLGEVLKYNKKSDIIVCVRQALNQRTLSGHRHDQLDIKLQYEPCVR